MALAQTSDGYVWIATQDGLVRFDGVRFTVFNMRSTPALTTNDIQTLYRDRQDRLWIGTGGGGLVVLEQGRFAAYGTEQGLPAQVVSAIHEDAAGALWIGTMGGGLSRYADGRFETYTAANGLVSNDVTSIAVDTRGAIWIGTHSGVSRLEKGRFVTYRTAEGLPSTDVRAVYMSRDGSIWAGTIAGLARLQDGRFTAYTTREGLSSNFIRSIVEDRRGTLWIATADAGLSRMHAGTVSHFNARNGLSDDDVRVFMEDDEGNLWIGTNVGGLNRLKNPTVVTYGVPEGLSHDVALAITADAAGTLWVATYGGGLNRFHDGRWTAYSTRHGLSSDVVLSLAPARDGGLWVGTRSGVDRFQNGRFVHYGRGTGLADEPVLALLEDRRGGLWAGTRTGLKHVNGAVTKTYTSADGLGTNIITALLEDRNGVLWIGTEGGGLSRLAPDGLRSYTRRNGLPNEIVWTITEDDDGALWLGTNGGGLVRMKDGRFTAYTAREGLIADSIFRILEDRTGNLWMSANKGIFRVRRQDLADFDAGKRPDIPAVWYDEADGMRSSEANGGIQPAGWQTRDGRLWFPTLKGVVMIDPGRPVHSAAPLRVIVEEVVVDRQSRDPRAPIKVEAGSQTLEFHYTAPGFQAPHQTAFRYRLEGYDPDWVDAGTRRAAYYTNLPPGAYAFRVMARHGDTGWSAPAPVVSLRLAPRFYQTYLFYVLCVIAALLAGFGVHRTRVHALHTRERELTLLSDERQRALDALGASEAQFRGLFENVFEGLYRTTPDGQILLVNRSFALMLGYDSADQLRTVNPQDLYVRAEDRGRFVAALAETGEIHEMEVALRRRDGRHVTVLESARAVRDERGDVQYIEGTLVDITARKRLEDENRQLQKMEVVGRLAGGIAHDFNNLLTPILGYSDVLLEELADDDPRRADVEEIRKAAESAGSLTRQLLAFSRQQILETRVLDVNEVTSQIERILSRLVGEHIDLRLRLDPVGSYVKADSGQIEQVLLNLAVNARDAMTTGGTLTIETSLVELGSDSAREVGLSPGRYVTLGVSDTGPGIPADVMPHLFQPFFTTKSHGTGLGLSTVHEIVEQAGGRIGVESEPGRGATFRVYLPEVAAPPEAAVPAASAVRETGSETILLAEDNDGLRELVRRVLERHGYKVLAARHAGEAKEAAARHPGRIDLLLTDVVMPGTSGPSLAADLAARRPALKVLFMTGYVDHDIWAPHASAALLQKPFTPAALLSRVREMFD